MDGLQQQTDGPEPAAASHPTAWRRFRRSPSGTLGLAALATLLLLGLLAPVISPYDPLAQVGPSLQAPSLAHPFGLDEIGRDILARVLVGAGPSLFTAIGAAVLAAAIGTPVGIVSGYLGGLADAATMRVTDFILALPGILSALVIIVVLGAGTD
ncbi:MAG: hypothetical protein JO264_02075, partial [Acidisphaera sp.]|nr:hypothetical protein [Acidisphaera sp.]